jgi:hypothetical protein
MKTSIKVALAALTIAALSFESCKKGENDPFLSLHTRKTRVSGSWTVKKGEGTRTSGSSTTTWTYDGATYTETQGSTSNSIAETVTMNFEKDGTFKIVDTYTNASVNYTETYTTTGTWNFTAGVGEDKNKDNIVLRTLSYTDAQTIGSTSTTSTSTYTGDSAPSAIYYLDELKNKEMIIT